MSQLTKAAILEAQDLTTELIEVPEWGGSLTVRTMTGSERDVFEDSISKATVNGRVDLRGLKVKLVVLTVLDDSGDRLFDDSDMAELNKKSASAIDRIFQVAQRLNGLTNEDVEELAGNSDGGQTADSGSA